jgi:hypothetical protein
MWGAFMWDVHISPSTRQRTGMNMEKAVDHHWLSIAKR